MTPLAMLSDELPRCLVTIAEMRLSVITSYRDTCS
jgi:hypothetical protein